MMNRKISPTGRAKQKVGADKKRPARPASTRAQKPQQDAPAPVKKKTSARPEPSGRGRRQKAEPAIGEAKPGRGKSREMRGSNAPQKRRSDANQDAKSEGERLHKALAQAGLGSRREMEEWIGEGKVAVNGKVAQIGMSVFPGDRVKVNGRLVTLRFSDRLPRVLLYHKPEGEIVSRSDPGGRPTVFAALPRLRGGRWVAVGRLDINTSGLLLFTSSGELANRLMHPSTNLLREYAARVLGELTVEAREQLKKGVMLEDGEAAFATLEEAGGEGANRWYRVSLHEGRNREVRRLFEAVGCKVSRLIRVRYGPFVLPPRLKRGHCLELTEEEVKRVL